MSEPKPKTPEEWYDEVRLTDTWEEAHGVMRAAMRHAKLVVLSDLWNKLDVIDRRRDPLANSDESMRQGIDVGHNDCVEALVQMQRDLGG